MEGTEHAEFFGWGRQLTGFVPSIIAVVLLWIKFDVLCRGKELTFCINSKGGQLAA